MKISLYVDMSNKDDLAQLKYLGELARKVLEQGRSVKKKELQEYVMVTTKK